MKYLIAGGAGFLGSYIVEDLLSKGHEVLAVDNLMTGSLHNLESFDRNESFTYLSHDIRTPLNIPVDGIINLACPASPVAYQSDPIGTWEASVLGGRNLLMMAHEQGVKILQTSTSEVYGDPLVSPQSEEYWGNVNPIGIRSCYDEGKRSIETLFTDFRRVKSTDARIARIFNSYGPRMAVNDGRAVSNFCVQALTGNPLTVYGDGSQNRSFCFVSDTVEGLIRMFLLPSLPEGPINIGNPRVTSLIDLAQLIIQLSGSSSTIDFRPLPQDDPITREPDITKAHSTLDWWPKIELEEGLIQTLSYFDSKLKSP